MEEMRYRRNEYDVRVFNTVSKDGKQCTATVHVDDLLITSNSKEMIEDLCAGLRRRCGDISKSDGPILNYLGMVFDLTIKGEARVTIKGFIDDVLSSCPRDGEDPFHRPTFPCDDQHHLSNRG